MFEDKADFKQIIPLLNSKAAILEIIKKNKYHKDFCYAGLQRLAELTETEKITDDEYLELLDNSGYSFEVKIHNFGHPSFTNWDNGKIWEFLAKADYYYNFAKAALPVIKLEKENPDKLFSLLEKLHYEEAFLAFLPFLNLKDRNFDDLIKLLRWLHYSNKAIEIILPLLNKCNNLEAEIFQAALVKEVIIKEVIQIFKKAHDMSKSAHRICLNILKQYLPRPSKKNDSLIMGIMLKQQYDQYVCRELIAWLKDRGNILFVLGKNSDVAVYAAGIKQLKADDPFIMEVAASNRSREYYLAALSRIKDKQLILDVIKKFPSEPKIIAKGLRRLDLNGWSREEIGDFLKLTHYGKEACRACKPRLIQLGALNIRSVFTMLQEASYSQDACQIFLADDSLWPAGVSEMEALQFLKQADYNYNVFVVCQSYVTFCENSILSVMTNYHDQQDHEDFSKFLSPILSHKSEDQIMKILKTYYFHHRLVKVALPLLTEEGNIITVMLQYKNDKQVYALGVQKLESLNHRR
jgi:hypothetical protein